VVATSFCLLLFQNCAKTQFSSVDLEANEKQMAPDDGDTDTDNTTKSPPSPTSPTTTNTIIVPLNCLFDGKTIKHGSEVTAYQNSAVPYGSACVKETRKCTNGKLSGSYNFAACAAGQAKMCLFNGQSIASGSKVKAYVTSTVPYGQTCKSEDRLCTNGELSGSYSYGSCQVDGPMACLFNGKTVAHGQSVMAYLTSATNFGESCKGEMRLCSNGKLGGSYPYASCTEGKAAACLFNGRTIAHLESVTAYQNSSVSYGQQCQMQTRTCNNGNLSGQYQYGSCTPGSPMSCKFNGQDVAHGSTVKAFESSTVSYGRTCVTQTRSCNNGSLNGSYLFSSCSVEGPRACLYNGRTILHGQSVISYTLSQVPYGQSCTTYRTTRTCNDGVFSGSAQAIYDTCGEGTPKACVLGDRTIAHGEKIVTYANSVVAYGGECVGQSRTCSNGVLSGTDENLNCAVENPNRCSFNGLTLDHGASTIAYQSAKVPFGSTCTAQERRCSNGSLSGSFTESTCTVEAALEVPVTPMETPKTPPDPCGEVVDEFIARQAVTSGSRAHLPAFVTKAVHQQSYCSDNGIDYIPTAQRTVAYVEANTRYHVCLYPGLPQWYDGGRWVGLNYFSSYGMNFSITGSYKIVKTRDLSWAPGFETIRQFSSRNGLTFIQAQNESYDIDNLWVCKRPDYKSSGGGGGNNHTQNSQL
jgi:hypothetical protein